MREKLIDLIKSIAPAVELDDPDLNLAEDMDSIDIIALISELEDEFDIEITMEEKTEENFENIDTLLKMIQRLQ